MSVDDMNEIELLLNTKMKCCPVAPIYNEYQLMFFSNTHRYTVCYSDHAPGNHLYIDRIGKNGDKPVLSDVKARAIIDKIKEHYKPGDPGYC